MEHTSSIRPVFTMYASLIKNDGTFGGGNPWTASVELKTADSWGPLFQSNIFCSITSS